MSEPACFQVSQLHAVGMSQVVDLQLNATDICIVSGASGSGKSQFLKSLADLLDHRGTVSLHGQAMTDMAPEAWRSQVMYFTAEPVWWKDTVAEHFEHQPDTKALSAIGLSSTLMQKPIETLSSGERQRFALLRGLQYQPKVLLLDEITANLDDDTQLKVEALVQAYIHNHQALAIWVSHQPEQIARLATTELVFTLTDKQVGSI